MPEQALPYVAEETPCDDAPGGAGAHWPAVGRLPLICVAMGSDERVRFSCLRCAGVKGFIGSMEPKKAETCFVPNWKSGHRSCEGRESVAVSCS